MNLRLDGLNAVVCGASKGLGKAVAKRFAEMGANLLIIARSQENLLLALNEIEEVNTGAAVRVLAADLSYPFGAVNHVVEGLDALGGADILVNNTGGPAPGPILDARAEEFISAFNSHLIAAHLLAQSVIPGMKVKKFGRIINIVSVGAKQPIENLGVSNTIRGAVNSWSKTLSKEVAAYGITVNNLLPGQTNTERLRSLIAANASRKGATIDDVTNEMIRDIPAGRFGEPEEFAAAAGFLASREAGFINGVNLPCDGGFLKGF